MPTWLIALLICLAAVGVGAALGALLARDAIRYIYGDRQK